MSISSRKMEAGRRAGSNGRTREPSLCALGRNLARALERDGAESQSQSQQRKKSNALEDLKPGGAGAWLRLVLRTQPRSVALQAFSLVEILVTVALLSFIILGLVAMFNQTRRAFTSSMTQVDVMESGRAAADMIGREIEQLSQGNSISVLNYYVDTPNSNNYVVQPLVDPADFRTNNLQRFYFLTLNNRRWTGIGYLLTNYNDGIGTLFRYSSTNIPYNSNYVLTNLIAAFRGAYAPGIGTNFAQIIPGVVDFRVLAYYGDGRPYSNLYGAGLNAPYINSPGTGSAIIATNALTADQYVCQFSGAMLPAYVEVELGVLEDRALAKYQALSGPGTGPGTPAYAYLTSHAGQVHIFRQRIPIRNFNPAAYP